MTSSLVHLHQVQKSFSDGEQLHQVLSGVDLRIQEGDTVALTGPSGTGKSTLLNLIAGFELPDAGEINLLNHDTSQWQDKRWSQFRRQHLGMVFQQFNLLTPLNVRDNIQFPLGMLNKHWDTWCDHLVESLGLLPLLKRPVEKLSGGQQQRVAIARALAHKPALLLADEPTGNLDQSAGEQVMALMCELSQQANTCILMVTHSQSSASHMARRWHLDNGQIHE